MIIIQLAGGLGNQMFQYALALQLNSLGKHVKIDDVSGFAEDLQRECELSVFGVAYERPTRKELIQMLDSSPYLWHKVRRKLFGRKKKSYFEEDKRFMPKIFEWDDIYLEGYWQSEKYFKGVEEQVRKTYDTDKLLGGIGGDGNEIDQSGQNELRRYLRKIENTESVSVHVRGGDYLLPQNQELFGGICSAAYYKKAMQKMREAYPDCTFYLFTNDIKRAKEQIDDEFMKDMTVIDLPADMDCETFALMSRCRHNILANSSYSWWASYLNRNPDKLVFAPERWLNGWDCRDVYREDMTVVGNDAGGRK